MLLVLVLVVALVALVVVCIFAIELNGTMRWISLSMAKLSGS